MEKKCVSRESNNFKILRSRINRNLFVYVQYTYYGSDRPYCGGGGLLWTYCIKLSEGPWLGGVPQWPHLLWDWEARLGGRGGIFLWTYCIKWSEGPWFWGGYHNDRTYSGIERPGCGGEGIFLWTYCIKRSEGPWLGGYHNDCTYSGLERPCLH